MADLSAIVPAAKAMHANGRSTSVGAGIPPHYFRLVPPHYVLLPSDYDHNHLSSMNTLELSEDKHGDLSTRGMSIFGDIPPQLLRYARGKVFSWPWAVGGPAGSISSDGSHSS